MRGESQVQRLPNFAMKGNGNGKTQEKITVHVQRAGSIVRSLSTRMRGKALSLAGIQKPMSILITKSIDDLAADGDTQPTSKSSNNEQVSPVCEILLPEQPAAAVKTDPDPDPEASASASASGEQGVRLRSHSFRQSKSTMSFREAKNNRLQLGANGQKLTAVTFYNANATNGRGPTASHGLPRTEGSFSSQKAIGKGVLLSPPSALGHPFRSASIADCTVRSPTIEFLPMYSELRKQKNLRNEIKDVWRHFDQDGDGSISMRELANVMTQFGHTPSELELRQMIEQVDEDGDGRIGWQEFSKMMDSQFDELDKQEQKMRRVFEYFDLNKDQFIDKHELFTVMNRLGDQLSMAEAEEMIRAADSDCDGLVSYSEFVAMMSSHLAQALGQ